MLELLETKKKAVNYYPFGKSFRSFTSSNGTHVYKYSGKEKDNYTDYSSYGFRYYNADLARWMNPDPAHQFNSPYVFNGNVPHLGSDKDGQWFWLAAAIAEWAGAAATTVAAIESAATVYAIASASYNLNKAVANGADFWEALGYTALSAGINYGVGQLAEGLNLSGDWVTQSLQGAGTALASSMITQLVFTGDVRLNDTYGEVLVGAAAGFVASENFHNWAAGDGFKTTRQILDERSNYEEVKLLKPDEMPLEPMDAPKKPKFEATELDYGYIDTWHSSTNRQVESLSSEMKYKTRKLINTSYYEYNIEAKLVPDKYGGGFRTKGFQDKLYKQGRTLPGKIITYARGGQSPHNFGKAVDILVPNYSIPTYRKLYKISQELKLDLIWGGNWSKPADFGHFQLK